MPWQLLQDGEHDACLDGSNIELDHQWCSFMGHIELIVNLWNVQDRLNGDNDHPFDWVVEIVPYFVGEVSQRVSVFIQEWMEDQIQADLGEVADVIGNQQLCHLHQIVGPVKITLREGCDNDMPRGVVSAGDGQRQAVWAVLHAVDMDALHELQRVYRRVDQRQVRGERPNCRAVGVGDCNPKRGGVWRGEGAVGAVRVDRV
mmetsp:Transcript_3860/g.6767  ORF Transcript_3860/g.6767 Transcript_3860/m.6767 type:complete len:202 (+) Transcript_3860:4391-4996(+)